MCEVGVLVSIFEAMWINDQRDTSPPSGPLKRTVQTLSPRTQASQQPGSSKQQTNKQN